MGSCRGGSFEGSRASIGLEYIADDDARYIAEAVFCFGAYG